MSNDFPELNPADFKPLEPTDVELQMRYLSREHAIAWRECADLEAEYAELKARYELAMAKSRIEFANKSKPNGKNYTVDERQDEALVANEDFFLVVSVLEARLKAARAKIIKLNAQSDLVRSVGSSIRSSLSIQ